MRRKLIAIATRFEELHGRFVIPVNHIHGYAGPGCDLLSVGSQEIRDRAVETRSIAIDDVLQFIEVKGRNKRTGGVELSENELSGAEKFGARFYIYRVFCDPTDPNVRRTRDSGRSGKITRKTDFTCRAVSLPREFGSQMVWFAGRRGRKQHTGSTRV